MRRTIPPVPVGVTSGTLRLGIVGTALTGVLLAFSLAVAGRTEAYGPRLPILNDPDLDDGYG